MERRKCRAMARASTANPINRARSSRTTSNTFCFSAKAASIARLNHSAGAFDAEQRGNANLDAVLLERYQRGIDPQRAPGSLPGRPGRTAYKDVLLRGRHRAGSV